MPGALPNTVANAVSALMAGAAAGLYTNTGSHGTPTWAENTLVESVQPTGPFAFAESKSRAFPHVLNVKTQIDLTAKVRMRADPANAHFVQWMLAAFSRTTTLDLLILNAKVTVLGAIGYRGEFLVSTDGGPQEIDNVIYQDFTIKAAYVGANASPVAQYVQIEAGPSPVYSAITY